MGVRSFRGRRVVARPPAAQMRLPNTALARPRKPRSQWEPGTPLYWQPRDPDLEAEMAWWGFRRAEQDDAPDDGAVWEAPAP